LQFLAYSDIHHDEYNNGLTEQDIVSVENQITEYAILNGIKHIFFLGDWYRATNPNRSVIAQAEGTWKYRSDNDIVTHVLVGNHDRWRKAIDSGHAFVSAEIFNNDLQNIKVYSASSQFQINDIDILCIPSGHENVDFISNYKRDNRMLIVLFHGLVAGSALANGASASSGVHPDVLRRLNADYILGGDNHTHQRLDDLLGCKSMYLGAPLQHNWGDRGQKRGFWHINISNSIINEKFIETKYPKFIRTKIDAKNDIDAMMQIGSLLSSELTNCGDGIVEFTFIGNKAPDLDLNIIEDNMKHLNVRSFKLSIDRMYEKVELSKGLSGLDKPEEKWDYFISNKADIKQLNPNILSDMGKWAISEAKRQI